MSITSFTVDTQCAENRYANVHVVRDLDGVRQLYHDWLVPRKDMWIGCDSETNAVDPWHPGYALRMLQFADERESWIVDTQSVGPHAVKALMRSHRNLVAHFSEADLRFIERGAPGSLALDDDRPHLWDNQVAQAYYDPRTVMSADKPNIDRRLVHPKGLKPSTTRELSPALEQTEAEFDAWAKQHAPTGWKRGQQLITWKFGYVPFDEEVYQRYGAMDPLMTIRLWHKQIAGVHNAGQWPIVESDLHLQWDIDRMTFRGLPVDEPYARWLDDQLWKLVERNAVILAEHGVPASGSGPSVASAFEAMGAISPKADPNSGARSYDKAVLKDFATWSGAVGRLARTITKSRQAVKFRAAYVKPMIESLSGDRHVHCSFRAIGTTTGRNSAARPALQQLPKKSTIVRSGFGNVPGWLFVTCDMKSGEPRVMAARSGDPVLHAAIESGGGINHAVAKVAFGDAYDESQGKTPGTPHYLMYNGAKISFLSGCYGAGDGKVDETAGVPKGTGLMEKWRGEYKVTFAREKTLNQQPYLVLDSGRVVRLWDRYTVDEHDQLRMYGKPSRLALNYDTQGSQADILRIAWARMRAAGWAKYLAIFVHDEIVMFVPEALAEACKQALAIAMTVQMANDVIMKSEATIEGPTWLPQPKAFNDDEIEFDISA